MSKSLWLVVRNTINGIECGIFTCPPKRGIDIIFIKQADNGVDADPISELFELDEICLSLQKIGQKKS